MMPSIHVIVIMWIDLSPKSPSSFTFSLVVQIFELAHEKIWRDGFAQSDMSTTIVIKSSANQLS